MKGRRKAKKKTNAIIRKHVVFFRISLGSVKAPIKIFYRLKRFTVEPITSLTRLAKTEHVYIGYRGIIYFRIAAG